MHNFRRTLEQVIKNIHAAQKVSNSLSPMFLRHNSETPSPEWRSSVSGERLMCSSQFTSSDIAIKHISSDCQQMKITWQSGHRSFYDWEWLNRYQHKFSDETVELAHRIRKFNFEPFLQLKPRSSIVDTRGKSSKELWAEILCQVNWQGYCVVKNYGLDNDRLMVDLYNNGFPRVSSHFGEKEKLMPNNTENRNNRQLGYTTSRIGLHTDLPFQKKVPELQCLHCLNAAPMGGENSVVSGKVVWNILDMIMKKLNSDRHSLLREEITFKRIDSEIREFSAPIIQLNSIGGLEELRSSYFTIEPFRFENIDMYYLVYNLFHVLARELAFTTKLEPGSFLLYSNRTCMHGRNAFEGNRLVIGTYHERSRMP